MEDPQRVGLGTWMLGSTGIGLTVGLLALTVLRFGYSPPAEPAQEATVTGLDPTLPVTVVVRGWLWDPDSRVESGPLEWFPEQVNSHLADADLETQFIQWSWSRIPADLLKASGEFVTFADQISRQFADSGKCVNFVGHSAGAAMIYRAATQDVRMGYMGTLGLPTTRAEKPGSVMRWANFYTSTHLDDVAGRFFAGRMQADTSVDLRSPHKDFWGAGEVIRISAEEIARSWEACAP